MLTSIRLQHFRSYTDVTFPLAPGVNIVVGPNASGKTNLLEAVLLCARGASYRAKDPELIQFNQPWARVEGQTQDESRVIKLDHQQAVTKKSYEIGGQVLQRLSMQKTLPTVVFEPNHLLLLTGSPDLRRTFIDDLIEQTVPNFGAVRRHYRRVLTQRNSLLKKGYTAAQSQVFVWNVRLAELGGKIVQERLRVLQAVNERATDMYRQLSLGNANVQVNYQSSIPTEQYETGLLHKLEANLERDCLIGYTTAGPHRDDIEVLLNDWRAEETASRGENRTLVLMLKLTELALLEQARGVRPILLLDDVFSELDNARRKALTAHLRNHQTIITTTDADVVTGDHERTVISLEHPQADHRAAKPRH
jgi:DNA replication and repair protein RecF